MSVLPGAVPRPGKCLAVAATRALWRPVAKLEPRLATVVGFELKIRLPRNEVAALPTSSTGARSTLIPSFFR